MILIRLYKGHLLIVVCFKLDSNIITNIDNEIKSVSSKKPSSVTPLSPDSNLSYSTETQHLYLNSKTETTIYKAERCIFQLIFYVHKIVVTNF